MRLIGIAGMPRIKLLVPLLVAVALVAAFVVAGARVGNAAADDNSITLTPGWNLVGWTGGTTPIDQALEDGGLSDRVTAVWGYSAANGWKGFFPAGAGIAGANDLTIFEHLAGYFVAVNGTGNIEWNVGSTTTTATATPTTATPTPTQSPTSTPTQSPTATPTETANGTIYADHSTYYTDSIGAVWVVGEVHNGLAVPVEFVEITANFYSHGTLVGTSTGYADLTAIEAGGTSSFSVLEIDPPAFDSVKYSVTDYDTDNFEPVITGLDAAITNTSTDSINYIHTVGTVTNTSSQTYQYVEVYVASYDSAGDVVAVDSTFANPDTLSPGQTGTFEALTNADDHEGQIVSRRLFVDASLS